MNRRDFFGSLAGVATFGFATVGTNAGAKFGRNSPPDGFPELNWIDLPTAVSDSVLPFRGDYIVGGHDAIYRVSGIAGPFKVTNDRRGCPCRLWATHIDVDTARVILWHR